VNEDAIPAIVKLSGSAQSDVRLAVAQILSSLSLAPHTRAAINKADGPSYLVQLLIHAMQDIPNDTWDEHLALAAGNALLQLTAASMIQSTGWVHHGADVGEEQSNFI